MAGRATATVLRGTVVTMDPARPRVQAIAVRGGRITALGADDAVLAAAGPGAEVIDLGAAAVLPAFIDPHHHLGLAALDRCGPSLALPALTSISELQRCLTERLRPGEGWARVHGLDPFALDEGRLPTAAELDEVCPDRPLLLLASSYHDAVVNSAGLRALGLGDRSPDPFGGALGRDRRGRLDGHLVESAAFRAEAVVRDAVLARDPQGWLDGCAAHADALLAAGIARVGDAAVPPGVSDLYAFAAAAGRLPLVVHRMPVAATSILDPGLGGGPTGSGPAATPVGPAKLLVDGGERCALRLSGRQALARLVHLARRLAAEPGPARTALRRAGRLRRAGEGRFATGVRLASDADVATAVATAAERGLQVALHAVGNDAVLAALAALAPVAADLDALPGRPRIEHAMVLEPRDAASMADAGVMAVVQPSFVRDLGDALRHRPLPAPLRLLPFRTLLDAGVEVAAGSDFPTAGYDVLGGVAAAVTRRTAGGRPLGPDQALTVEEALRAVTATAARALGVEREAGTLRLGARADLVVLSADPTAVEPEALAGIRVLATYVAGAAAFASAAAPAPTAPADRADGVTRTSPPPP